MPLFELYVDTGQTVVSLQVRSLLVGTATLSAGRGRRELHSAAPVTREDVPGGIGSWKRRVHRPVSWRAGYEGLVVV